MSAFKLSNDEYQYMQKTVFGDKDTQISDSSSILMNSEPKVEEQGFMGDVVDSFQMGAWRGASHLARGLGTVLDSEWLNNTADWAARGADENMATMSNKMREALGQSAFDGFNEETGEGQGVLNAHWWAGNLGALLGEQLDTVATLGAGKLATTGIKFAAKKLSKEAAEQIGEVAVKEAAKRGVPENLQRAMGVTAVMSAMSAGNRASQVYDEVGQMSNEDLANLEGFKQAYWGLKESPKGQNLTHEELFEQAKQSFRNKVGRTAALDPTAIATDIVSNSITGLGGGLWGLAKPGQTIKKGVMKGALLESGTEGWQSAAEQYAINRTAQQYYDPNRDIHEGVKQNVVDGMVLGSALGGVMGGIDAIAHKSTMNKERKRILEAIDTGNPEIDARIKLQVESINNFANDLDDLISNQRINALNAMGRKEARAMEIHSQMQRQQEDDQADDINDDLNALSEESGDLKLSRSQQEMPSFYETENIYSVFEPNQIKSATNNTGEFDVSNDDIRFSFAGMNAQNADNAALVRAMDMVEDGLKSEEIRQQTGWFQGADGKWRFEVMEDPRLIKPHQVYEDFQWETEYNQNELKTRLSEVWKDNRLFKAYPHLANLKVTIKPLNGDAKGYFDPTAREIVLSSLLGEGDMRSVLVHEVQHVIQGVERFLNGSNLEIEKARFKGSQTGNIAVDAEIAKLEKTLSQTQDLNRIIEIQSSIDSYKDLVAENNYWRAAGEVEARNAQTRLNMTEEERRTRSPESTEDILRNNQILRDYKGEKSFSLNEDPNSSFAKAVDEVASGKTTQQQVIDVGTTPDVLKMLGLPDANVVISGAVLHKVMQDKHNVTVETLKQLPREINNPVAVMKSSTQPNGYVVLTELVEHENGKDKPVIAALHLKQDANGLELINIASFYGRSNAQIQRGLENDLLYWNKEKGAKFLDNLTLQLRSPLSENSSIARNIKTENDLSQYIQNKKQPQNPNLTSIHNKISRFVGKHLSKHFETVTAAEIGITDPTVEAGYNPKTGKIFIVADNIRASNVLTRDERLAWVAWHELAHRGLGVKFGAEFNDLMAKIDKNSTINKLANAIQKQRSETAQNRHLAVEEALAELHAAYVTGKLDELKNRYGIEIPKAHEKGLKSWFEMTAQRIREFIAKLFGKGTADKFSHDDLINLLTEISRSAGGEVRTKNNVKMKHSFAGENAKTANHSLLAKAKSAIENDTDPEIVRQQTGWFKGVDGKWRFEIDDSHAKFINLERNVLSGHIYISVDKPLSEILQHPYIFKAYPQLANIRTKINIYPMEKNPNGATHFDGEGKPYFINVVSRNEQEALGTLIHEVQHAIQEYENFAKGDDFFKIHRAILKKRYNLEDGFKKVDYDRAVVNELNSLKEQEKALWKAYRQAKRAGNTEQEVELEKAYDEVEQKISLIEKGSIYSDEAFQRYQRAAGETESRNVESRLTMDAEQRRNTSPFKTQDVATDDQIILFDHSGDALSINEALNVKADTVIDEGSINNLERAKEQGYNTDYYYRHATQERAPIEQIGKKGGFGGIFALKNDIGEQRPNSVPYGTHYEDFIIKGEPMTHEEFSSALYQSEESYEKAKDIIASEAIVKKDSLTDDEWEKVFEYITEDKSIMEDYGYNNEPPEFIQDVFGVEEEQFINAQKYRIQLAKEFGANAVDMYDETGTSVALLPSASVRSIYADFDPEKADQPYLRFSRSPYESDAEKIKRAFESIGLNVWQDSSRVSNSEYITVVIPDKVDEYGEPLEYKVRVSDHALPSSYTQADFDVAAKGVVNNTRGQDAKLHTNGSWVDAVKYAVNKYNLRMPAVIKRLESEPKKDSKKVRKPTRTITKAERELKKEILELEETIERFKSNGTSIGEDHPFMRSLESKRIKLAEMQGIKFSKSASLNSNASVLELSRGGNINPEPKWWDVFTSRKNLKEAINKGAAKLDEWLADSLRPVNDWIDEMKFSDDTGKTSSHDHEKRRLKDAMYTAKGKRDALNSELETSFLKPILSEIAQIAKQSNGKINEETAKRKAGFWVSARYSIEKNMELLKIDEQAMLDAEKTLDDAKANGSGDEVREARKAFDKAEKQYLARKADVWNKDFNNKNFKIGVAGGWSIPEAQEIMRNIEKDISRSELESIGDLIADLNQARLDIDYRSGRYTTEEYNKFKDNHHYVPLTGDPNAEADDFDFIGGTGANSLNIAKDKTLKGRTSSEAEDAIDAVWKAVGKTTTYAGWSDFKNKIDDLFETEVSLLKDKGYTEKEAREQASKNIGISKRRMQGLTRSSDNVLIAKQGGLYYEYELPEKAMNALKNDNVEYANAFLKALSKPTSWYARGVTQWTLTFAPINMFRDTWEKSEFIRVQKIYDKNGKLLDSKTMDRIGRSVIANSINPNKGIWQATKRFGFGQELRDNIESERLLKELLKNGGISNYGTYLDRIESDLIKKLKRENNPIASKLDKVAGVLESYNKMFDTVSALAAYKSLIDNGVDSKQAAAITLNLTNFRKTGSKMKGIKALYLFSQPTVMGAANLIRYLSTRKGQLRFLGYMAGMTALYTVLRSMDDEDEGGNKMDQLGDITRFIPIPLGNGDYFKMPVGFGMPQMAWNFATNIVKGTVSDISFMEAGVNMLSHSMKTFAPVSPSEISAAKYPLEKLALTVTPSILQPLTQNVVNRSAFGSKITTNFVRDDKLKAEQSKSTTAQFWKDLAIDMQQTIGIDMHPEQIKNLFDGYGAMLGSLRELSTIFVENPNREQLGRNTRTPFLNQLYGAGNEFAVQSRYYEASEEAQSVFKEYTYRKENKQLNGWLTPERQKLIKFHEKNAKVMGELRSEKGKLTRQLREGKISSMTYENRIRKYNQSMDKLQRKILTQYRRMEGLNTH